MTGPAARDDNGTRADQGANDERAGGDQATQGDLGASMRAYPHSDGDTMMTILGHDNADGLELLVRGETIAEDRWVEVPHIEGGLVVQLGQMMQRMTNDVFLATPHRVVMPADKSTIPERTSIVMFYRPGLQTKIAPPPSLAARHKNALGGVYEPVTTQEFLEMPRTDAEGNSVKLTVRRPTKLQPVACRLDVMCAHSDDCESRPATFVGLVWLRAYGVGGAE